MQIRLSRHDSRRLLEILGVSAQAALRQAERRRRLRLGLAILIALLLAAAIGALVIR